MYTILFLFFLHPLQRWDSLTMIFRWKIKVQLFWNLKFRAIIFSKQIHNLKVNVRISWQKVFNQFLLYIRKLHWLEYNIYIPKRHYKETEKSILHKRMMVKKMIYTYIHPCIRVWIYTYSIYMHVYICMSVYIYF